MSKIYSNLPIERAGSNADATVRFFDQYYNQPLELDGATLNSMKAFFEKRGFAASSAETISLTLMSQAKKDNIPAMKLIDTLDGFDDVRLSDLVGEILNYNRFKTSTLGIYINPNPGDEIQRNILA